MLDTVLQLIRQTLLYHKQFPRELLQLEESLTTIHQLAYWKIWQDRTQSGFTTVGVASTSPQYGFDQVDFTSSPGTGGALTIIGGSVSGGLSIDSTFTGVSTVINNRTFYLGQSFTNGIANPEVAKFSGEIIYVDNRPNVTRSTNQKEDIKVILQFNKELCRKLQISMLFYIMMTLILWTTIIEYCSNPDIQFRREN